MVLQTALVCYHPTPGNRNSGKEPGERDSQAETKSCGASTIPAEGERSDLRNGASPEGCLTSAEISLSQKSIESEDVIEQRDFLVQLVLET